MIEGGVEPTHRSIASRMRLLSAIVALAALVSACAIRPAGEPAAVRLVATAIASGFRLTLLPAPGARINARLKPVLELDGGQRLQFDAASITADSAYFAVPPTAELRSRRARLQGVLRVGVCPAGLNVCRSLAVPVDLPLPTG